MEDYVEAWRRRFREERERRRKRAQAAEKIARRCAHLLHERYGVSKVYQFGSLKDAEEFHERSDIDLAVEGLAPSLYFRALAELWRQLPPGMELDLVPLEDADPELQERLMREGVVLHG